jgi:hypothetical protein
MNLLRSGGESSAARLSGFRNGWIVTKKPPTSVRRGKDCGLVDPDSHLISLPIVGLFLEFGPFGETSQKSELMRSAFAVKNVVHAVSRSTCFIFLIRRILEFRHIDIIIDQVHTVESTRKSVFISVNTGTAWIALKADYRYGNRICV